MKRISKYPSIPNLYAVGVLVFLIQLSLHTTVSAQAVYKQGDPLEWVTFLAGVKYATIEQASHHPEKELFYTSTPNAIEAYLKKRGISILREGYEITSLCDVANITYYFRETGGPYSYRLVDFTLTFTSCNGKVWIITLPKISFGAQANQYKKLRNAIWRYLTPQQLPYKLANRYTLRKRPTKWTEMEVRMYLQEGADDQVEGIYESIPTGNADQAQYKLALIKEKSGFTFIYLNGATYSNDWEEGEVKADLIKTATNRFFKAEWIMANKVVNPDVYIEFEEGAIIVNFTNYRKKYIKTYPIESK